MSMEAGQNEAYIKRAPDNFEEDEDDDIGDIDEGGKREIRGHYQT